MAAKVVVVNSEVLEVPKVVAKAEALKEAAVVVVDIILEEVKAEVEVLALAQS